MIILLIIYEFEVYNMMRIQVMFSLEAVPAHHFFIQSIIDPPGYKIFRFFGQMAL